jgi:predicted metal-dependent hydrolase
VPPKPSEPTSAGRARRLDRAPQLPLAGLPPQVEVRRSTRRRKTVSAYRDGDLIVVMVPARMSRAEERHWVEVMTKRLAERDARHQRSDTELLERARELSRRHLGGRARPASVRWVDNQRSRWGSCTIEDRTIRLSTRLQGMPEYVGDYVLLHELAHLVVPDHGPRFWALLESYPKTERARGFLDGWSGAVDGWAGTGTDERDADDTVVDEG